jgi:hypothetical protein
MKRRLPISLSVALMAMLLSLGFTQLLAAAEQIETILGCS